MLAPPIFAGLNANTRSEPKMKQRLAIAGNKINSTDTKFGMREADDKTGGKHLTRPAQQ